MNTAPNGLDLQVGKQVSAARRAAGLSIADLAERMQLSVSIIESIERGTMRVAAPQICKLASMLNVEIRWFFKREGSTSGVDRETSRVACFDKARASEALNRLIKASAVNDPPQPPGIRAA